MARPGRKSAAQTPAPPSERIKGSSKNPKGTASSKKSASGIRFSAKTLKSLSQKRDEHNSKYKRKASLPQLKAVYRRGLGAFSSSHRPTITGGAPNSRNAWAMARVNKFLLKLAGKKVKAAYVQDDDLMEDGGVTKETTTEFMNWFAGWVKPLRGKMNIGMSIPNEYSQIKGVDDFVFLDVFEKIGQDIDAKPHLKEILSKADELGVSLVLEPIPRHHEFLDDAAKRKKIDRQYLIGYYSKFGFSLMDNGLMHRMPGSVMADIRGMNKLIVCRGCGWRWNTADSDESDKYVCHQCGFDNRTYYDADPIGSYANDGKVLDLINRGIVELKMFDTTPEHAKEYGLDSKRPLYLQKIYISKQNTLKGIGSEVIEYIIDYAKKNEHDLIFGHITQKAEPNIDVIKSMLREAGFNTIEGNDDFYKKIDTKYADGGLIAPNGNPSNLTPEQWHLVRTPEFKAWFGDWENDPENASKVLDENGEPKIMYHGSRSQFTTFDLSKGGESNTLARVGFWFSPNEGFGLNFTAGTWWGDIKGDYGIEYAVFLSIKNPKLFVPGEPGELFSDSYEKFKTDIYALAGQSARDANIGGLGMALNNARQTINDYRSMLKKDGYDGILIKQTRFDKRTAGDLNDQIVALYPEQIKLADGSNVTFDPNNPDIRYHLGGEMSKHLAPNGKPSNLTHEQWHLVRTPEFKAWFGDWENDPANASKVVDENGEPKIMWHNSPKLFTIFDPTAESRWINQRKENVIWFGGSNKVIAYSEGEKGFLYQCFLKSLKPIIVDAKEYDVSDFYYDEKGNKTYTIQRIKGAFVSRLGEVHWSGKKNDNDGVIFYNAWDNVPLGMVVAVPSPNQIKLADGSNVTFDPNNPDIRFDEGGKIEKMAETLELTQNSAQYAAGGSTDDCGCGDKAEFGMETNAGQSVHKNDKVLAEVNAILDKYGYEAIKKGEYPIGKVAKGMTIEDIARRHRFPIQDMKKSLELGIRTEKEHTNDQLIAEKIALDHLYEDAEYYQKLQKIEKLYKGSEIDYDFNPMDFYVERDDKRTSVSLYLRDEKIEANNVLFSNEKKLSKGIICREKINHAIDQENKAINALEKNFWQAVKNIWENCMLMLTNHYYHAITNVENSYSLQDVYTYANGGLAYGNSHSKGGIPLYNKGSKSWIEIEGGEGVVKKESMHMNKALEFEGKKMSACEIVSQINQMTGGVKFKCADVKKIMDNDGNYD